MRRRDDVDMESRRSPWQPLSIERTSIEWWNSQKGEGCGLFILLVFRFWLLHFYAFFCLYRLVRNVHIPRYLRHRPCTLVGQGHRDHLLPLEEEEAKAHHLVPTCSFDAVVSHVLPLTVTQTRSTHSRSP